jgi:hypothetical protein
VLSSENYIQLYDWLTKKIAVKKIGPGEFFLTDHIIEICSYFHSSKQFCPVEKRGSENMNISGLRQ